MVRPIPMNLLRDTVTYEEYDGGDRWGESFKPAITLSNVRVQEMTSLSVSSVREQRDFKSLLFFDAVNSKADTGFTFVEKSKVTYNGQVLVVNKVTPVHAFNLHHYEVELI